MTVTNGAAAGVGFLLILCEVQTDTLSIYVPPRSLSLSFWVLLTIHSEDVVRRGATGEEEVWPENYEEKTDDPDSNICEAQVLFLIVTFPFFQLEGSVRWPTRSESHDEKFAANTQTMQIHNHMLKSKTSITGSEFIMTCTRNYT